MCGIYAVISTSPPSELPSDLRRCLCSRGPDHLGSVQTQISAGEGENANKLYLNFTSTVLALRGDHVTKQPLVHEATGSVLCWNGEAWKIQGTTLQGNDTEAVFALLQHADRPEHVLDALRSIEGPFAFIYLDKPRKRLYYGRDRLGRRSLLLNPDSPGAPFSLASISEAPVEGWSEVEADGCYTIQLDQGDPSMGFSPTRHGWACDAALVSSVGVFNASLPDGPHRLHLESKSVGELHGCLIDSLQLRVLNVPVPPNASNEDARIAVLFSGGLDCTVLARLTHDILPPGQSIDLLNVAFENPRIASQNPSLSQYELYEKCPDRCTGRSSFEELTKVCPDRPWRFVTINVPYAETLEHRRDVIRLIYPHNTEMDLSIACALYFAARGQGQAQSSWQPMSQSQSQPYRTTARVLLSGLGADELLGGYQRHPTAYSRRGYSGLVEELELDVSRLGKRNLGRDDRVMAHWGREVRFPYLDERVVKWAIESPVWDKCDFENPGNDESLDAEKRVLRLLAKKLGMGGVAMEKKRAIQFGARTAKMESGKVKGTNLLSG